MKWYPGSAKGPTPEHDPEHFVDWFAKNHPPKAVDALFSYASSLVAQDDSASLKDIVRQQPTVVYTLAHEALQ